MAPGIPFFPLSPSKSQFSSRNGKISRDILEDWSEGENVGRASNALWEPPKRLSLSHRHRNWIGRRTGAQIRTTHLVVLTQTQEVFEKNKNKILETIYRTLACFSFFSFQQVTHTKVSSLPAQN